jgi:threonine dehydrogenase-like Zn-dependent dehydrogenase
LGATHAINPGVEDARSAIFRLTEGKGAHFAFEAVGVSSTVDLALGCVRKGGAVTLVGNVAPRVDFPLQVAVTRELSILGSCASRGEYPACLEMMARGALNPGLLISAVAPLADGALWFQRLHDKEPGLLKVVLQP